MLRFSPLFMAMNFYNAISIKKLTNPSLQEEVLSSLESHQDPLPYLFRKRELIKCQTRHVQSILNFFMDSFPSSFHAEFIFEVPPHLLAILSVLYGSISLLAVVGNLLVIWIVKTTRQMHTVTNFFIGKWNTSYICRG